MKRFRDAGVGRDDRADERGALCNRNFTRMRYGAETRYAELYGCYGLPTMSRRGVSYAAGQIRTPSSAGLGTRFDASRCRTVWTEDLG